MKEIKARITSIEIDREISWGGVSEVGTTRFNAIVYGLASLDPSKPIIITQEDEGNE